MSGEGAPPTGHTALPTRRIGVLLRVLLAQFLAFVLVLAGAWSLSRIWPDARPPAWAMAPVQAVFAVLFSKLLKLKGGWLAAQFALPLLAWAGVILHIPSGLFLALFAVLALVYTNVAKERVPLYLTNRTTWAALSEMIDEHRLEQTPGRFIDLGCGLGGTLAYLAHKHPDWRFVGVETAPIPYLISKLRTWSRANVEVRFESLWDADLTDVDIAYAFLSPAPMPRLLAHANTAMKPGAMLISNSFWAPDSPYDGEIEVADGRKSRLFFNVM